MTLWAEASALARAGKPKEAVALIERAAAAGDGEANLIVAHWNLYGSDRPRDIAAGHRHLELSARTGNVEAIHALANLIAGGVGCEPDEARAIGMLRGIAERDALARVQLELLAQLMGEDQVRDARRERLSSDPRIEIVHDLLEPAECAYLMQRAEPLLKPSFVDDPVTGRGKPDPIRTSHGAGFVPHAEDLVVRAINRRLALASGTAVDHAEALYVMRYTPGQEYKPHLDALGGLRNQREWTAIAYLNREYEGGETVFPKLSVSIRAEPGDVLIFRNVDSNGGPDPRLRHAGLPVTRGEKWIATRWIRTARHDPYDRG